MYDIVSKSVVHVVLATTTMVFLIVAIVISSNELHSQKKTKELFGEENKLPTYPELSFSHVNHPMFGDVYVIDARDMISRSIMNHEEWEPELNAEMEKYYISGTDFLDIGANMGFSSLGINFKKTITGTVHAFEPQFRLCTILAHNLQTLQSTKIYNCAVSDHPSLISYVTNVDNIGATSIISAKESNSGLYVPTIKLDDHINMFVNRISLIKIDVEGHELQVLKGALDIIQMYKPVLVVESYGSSQLVLDIIGPLGYKQVWNLNADYIYTV